MYRDLSCSGQCIRFIALSIPLMLCLIIITTCIINFYHYIAPRIFPLAYNLFKPFMDETTKRRVFILGGNCH